MGIEPNPDDKPRLNTKGAHMRFHQLPRVDEIPLILLPAVQHYQAPSSRQSGCFLQMLAPGMGGPSIKLGQCPRDRSTISKSSFPQP